MKIVIVGNGTGVLGKERGLFINSCDIVIRCNTYQIKGYEKHVGTKTDILAAISAGAGGRVLSRNFDKNQMSNIKEVWFSRPKSLSDKNHVRFIKKYITNHKIEYVSKVLFDLVLEKSKTKYPSTGFIAIAMAINKFKYPIYITGFDNFETNHYFNKSKKIGGSHPSKIEKELMDQYERENKIIIL